MVFRSNNQFFSLGLEKQPWTDKENLPTGEPYQKIHPIIFPKHKNPKITQFCVSSHVLFLSSDGRVFSKGKGNYYGQLGIGDKMFDGKTNEIEWFSKKRIRIVQVSVGGNYSLYLDDMGNVYGSGDNTVGCCGDDKENNKKILFPKRFESIGCCREMTCSYGMSIFLLKNGAFIATGKIGNLNVSKVQLFKGEEQNIKKISFGNEHCVVLKKNNEVWMFGKSQYGQLGKVDWGKPSLKLEKMDHGVFNDEKIVDAYAEYHNTIYYGSKGNVYSSGMFSFEYLEKIGDFMRMYMESGIFRMFKELKKPTIINKNISKKITYITSNNQNSFVICDNGDCYSLGPLFFKNEKGRSNKKFYLEKRFDVKWEKEDCSFQGKLLHVHCVKSLSFVNVGIVTF